MDGVQNKVCQNTRTTRADNAVIIPVIIPFKRRAEFQLRSDSVRGDLVVQQNSLPSSQIYITVPETHSLLSDSVNNCCSGQLSTFVSKIRYISSLEILSFVSTWRSTGIHCTISIRLGPYIEDVRGVVEDVLQEIILQISWCSYPCSIMQICEAQSRELQLNHRTKMFISFGKRHTFPNTYSANCEACKTC